MSIGRGVEKGYFYRYGKGMSRISTKNQVTIPIAILDEAGLHAGEQVVMEPVGAGELLLRRLNFRVEDAFGALTNTYPAGYLEQLDAEDLQR